MRDTRETDRDRELWRPIETGSLGRRDHSGERTRKHQRKRDYFPDWSTALHSRFEPEVSIEISVEAGALQPDSLSAYVRGKYFARTA